MPTPRDETTAFRIWQYANPRGWDVSLVDIANALGVDRFSVQNICRCRGWTHRTRVLRRVNGNKPLKDEIPIEIRRLVGSRED